VTTVIIAPTDDEINEAVSLHHDFDCPLKDADVSISQPYSDDLDNADVICFHPDRIPALVAELVSVHEEWLKEKNYFPRDVPTAGEW
jgi:hypothetical protein